MTYHRIIHRATIAALVLVQIAAASFAFAETPVVDQAPEYSLSRPRTRQAVRLLPPETKASPLMVASLQQDRLPEAGAQTYSLADTRQLLSESKVAQDNPAAVPAVNAAAPEGKEWPWRRASTAEYVSVILATGGALYIENEHGNPSEPNWTAHNGVDESMRNLLRLKSRAGRDAAATAGDVLMWGLIAAPVVETFATLGIRDSHWDALWQTSMINLDSFAFTSIVSSVLQNVIKREKPFARNCTDGDCEDKEPNRSMPSGHVAFAFTGAGLLCNHHYYQSQSLYGDTDLDKAVCATGIVLAAGDGFLRIMADRHYFTDVVAGTVMGLFSGFVLPRLLHYSHPSQPAPDERKSGESFMKQVTLSPQLLDGGGALNCGLRF